MGERPRKYKQWLREPTLEIPRSTMYYRQRTLNQNTQCHPKTTSVEIVPELLNCAHTQHTTPLQLQCSESCGDDDGTTNANNRTEVHDEFIDLSSATPVMNYLDDDVFLEQTQGNEAVNYEDTNGDGTTSNDGVESHWLSTPAATTNIHLDENSHTEQQKLYNGGPVTRNEAELLILAFAGRHNLTDVALDDLLKLFNAILPYPVFDSKYLLLSKYKFAIKSKFLKKQYYCDKCFLPLSNEKFAKCTGCKRVTDIKKLDHLNQYFLHIPLAPQLEEFVNSSLYDISLQYRKQGYSDVFNGDYYLSMCGHDGGSDATTKIISKDVDVTLQFNTDGANYFESSKISLWPVLFMVNELPYHIRRSRVLLAGLWFSKHKPDVNLFLENIVNELKILNNSGISRTIDNDLVNVKVHVIICSADSIARPLLQNISQFNGKFGCSFCLLESKKINLKKVMNAKGNQRVYSGDEVGPLRTWRQHYHDCKTALDIGKPVNGVKGPSIVSLIPNFNITRCFSTDYLHNVCLGVVKSFVESWFDSKYKEKKWYLGNRVEEFDEIYLNFRPPVEVPRTPRSVKEIKYWKANELKNFLLYFSIPCVQELMPKNVPKHWGLLAYAIYTYLMPRITDEDATLAETCLQKFVRKIGSLYGIEFYRFNTHLLLHIPKCVKDFGALWAHSTFPYERYNGILGGMFSQSKCVPQQIVKNYYRNEAVRQQCASYYMKSENRNVKQLMFNFNVVPTSADHLLNCTDNQQPILSASSHHVELNPIQKSEITNMIGCDVLVICDVFNYGVFKKMCIHSSSCGKAIRRHNSTVSLLDNTVIEVLNILKVYDSSGEHHVLLEGEVLKKLAPPTKNKFYKRCVFMKKTGIRQIVFPRDIFQKCVLLEMKDLPSVYVMPLANFFERD